jgi:hypothetical protein
LPEPNKGEDMLQNVKCYFRDKGKLAVINVTECHDYKHAIWSVRNQILGERDAFFEVKQPVMAIVQK